MKKDMSRQQGAGFIGRVAGWCASFPSRRVAPLALLAFALGAATTAEAARNWTGNVSGNFQTGDNWSSTSGRRYFKDGNLTGEKITRIYLTGNVTESSNSGLCFDTPPTSSPTYWRFRSDAANTIRTYNNSGGSAYDTGILCVGYEGRSSKARFYAVKFNTRNFTIGGDASLGGGTIVKKDMTGYLILDDLDDDASSVWAPVNITAATCDFYNGWLYATNATITSSGNMTLYTFNAEKTDGDWTLNGDLIIGAKAGASATFTQNSGTVTVKNNKWTKSTSGNGTLNLNGGTFVTQHIEDQVAGGSLTVNIDGGTIKANNAHASGLITHGNGAGLNVNVGANGGTIDAAGYNVTIAEDLDNAAGATGKMTFKGGGTVTLSGAVNYTGGTTVEAGTVVVVPDVAKRTALGAITVTGLENNIYEVVRLSGEGTFSASDLPANTETVTFAVSPDGKSILAAKSPFWIGGSGDLSTASNWSGGVVPTENPMIKWSTPITLTNSGGFAPNTLTIPDDSAVVTLAGALTVNCLTNASRLAVASTGSLTVTGDLVATVESNGGSRTFLHSNDGTVTVGGKAIGYTNVGGYPNVFEYAAVTENTRPIQARGIAYQCGGSGQLGMKLQSDGNTAGSWVVGADGFSFPGCRNANYTTFFAESAAVTLYSADNWTLANSKKSNTTRGDLYVSNASGSSLTIDTSDYVTPATRRTVTLEGRIVAYNPVTIKGCGTVVVDTTGSNTSVFEDFQHTCLTNAATLYVTDTATLKINAGKKITGNGTVALDPGTTLTVSNAVDGSVTLPSISAAAGSTVFIAEVGSATPAIVLTGGISGPEVDGYAMLKKGGGPFAAGEYAIFSAADAAGASSAAEQAQKYLKPELVAGKTYRYVADGTVVKLEVSDFGDYVWVGGASGNFSVASNWHGNKVPGADADIYIGNDTAANLTNDIEGFAPASITFLPGSAPVTIGGNAITGVAAVTNAAYLNMTFACPVDFGSGNIDVTETATYNDSTKAISGGCVVFAGGVRGVDVANHTIFTGNYTLTKTDKFSFTTSGNDRAVLNTNATFNVKSTDQIHELYIKSGATFHVENASHNWSGSGNTHRLWCWNQGTFIADSYTLTGDGQMWLGGATGSAVNSDMNSDAVLKIGTTTVNSNGQIWLHGYGNPGDEMTIYIGAGGLNIASGKTGYFGVENKNHPSTIRPLNSDFTIGGGSNADYDFRLANEAVNFAIHTTDEGGTARTVTLEGRITTEGHADTTITVKGTGTNVVNSASPLMVGTYAVADTATLLLHDGAGFANGTVSVGATATLAVRHSDKAYAGNLTFAAGSTLLIDNSEGTQSYYPVRAKTFTLPASGTVNLTMSATPSQTKGHKILYSEGSQTFTSADLAKFTVPEGYRLNIANGGKGIVLYYGTSGNNGFWWTGNAGTEWSNAENWLGLVTPTSQAAYFGGGYIAPGHSNVTFSAVHTLSNIIVVDGGSPDSPIVFSAANSAHGLTTGSNYVQIGQGDSEVSALWLKGGTYKFPGGISLGKDDGSTHGHLILGDDTVATTLDLRSQNLIPRTGCRVFGKNATLLMNQGYILGGDIALTNVNLTTTSWFETGIAANSLTVVDKVGGDWMVTNTFRLGNANGKGSTTRFYHRDGTLDTNTTGDWFTLGDGLDSTNEYYHIGGTLTVRDFLLLGDNKDSTKGRNYMEISGGTVNHIAKNHVVVGYKAGAGTVNELRVCGTGVLNARQDIFVGGNTASDSSNAGGGNGLLRIDGGEVNATNGWVYIGCSALGGEVALNGGTLATKRVKHGGGSANGTLSLNGGTLKAAADDTSFILNNAKLVVTVGANGGTIDNDSHNITLAQSIAGTGTLTLSGAGTTTLAAGVDFACGAAVASGTTLAVGGAGNALGALALADGATLDITTPGAAAAVTLGSGALTLPASGTVSLKKGGGAFAAGTYAILTKSGITVADVQGKLVPQVADGATYLYKVGGDTLYLTVGAAGDYVWSGLGDTVNFNDPNNWLTRSVPPAGATVYIAVATNSTLVCNIASFAPTSMVFTAGAQMTIAPGTDCKITGLQTIRNESGVRHVLNVPTEFKSSDADAPIDAPIDVTGEIDFQGGVTGTVPANHSKFYGNYTLTATSWSISSAITLAENATVTAKDMTLTLNNEKLLVAGANSKFKLKELNFNRSGRVFGDAYFSGTLDVETLNSTSKGEIDPILNAAFKGVFRVKYLSGDTPKHYVDWNLGGVGVVGGALRSATGGYKFGTPGNPTVIRSSDDWTMINNHNKAKNTAYYNYGFEIAASCLCIDTSDYDGGEQGHTVSVELGNTKEGQTDKTLRGSGGLAVFGNGTFWFKNNCSFTGGFTASNSVTVTVNDGVQPGNGNVTVRDTATLEVKGATTISGALSFVGAGTKLKIGSLTPGKTAITAASLALPESGTVALSFTTAPTAGRTYTLATVTGDQTLTSDDLAKFSVPAGYRLLLADAGKSIVLGGSLTWTGAGADTLWATGGNWQGGVAPTGACEPGFIEAFITGSRTATFGAADSYTGHLWVDAGTAANPIVFAPSGASGSLSDGIGSYYLYVGQNATEANLVIERGMHLDTGLVRVGGLDTSTSHLTVKGSIYSGSHFCLGVENYAGAPVAVLDIDGGAVTNKTNDLVIGDFLGSGNGQFTAIVQNGGQYVSLGNGIRVSSGSSGTLAITNGTVLAENANVNMGNKDKSGIGRLILGPGALLSTTSVTSLDSTSTGHTLVFGGGTLRASADGVWFIDSRNSNGVARVVVEVESAGGTIDTNGKKVGFRTVASGAGGLTVTGGGELFFDNIYGSRTASAFDYTGATTVAGGTAIRSAATNTTFAGNLVLQSDARVKVGLVSSQVSRLSASDVTVASGVRVVPDAVFAKGTYPVLTKSGGGSFTQADVDGMVLDDSVAYGLADAAHLALGGENNDSICLVVEYGNVIQVKNRLTAPPTLTGDDVIVGAGGVDIQSLSIPENGVLTLDPIKTPVYVYDDDSHNFTIGEGAKIALSPNYAGMTLGRIQLIAYKEAGLVGMPENLNDIFDASSIAPGAVWKVTSEDIPNPGGDPYRKKLILTVGNYENQAKEIRLTCIGDSITQGTGDGKKIGGTAQSGYNAQYRTAIAARLAANGYRPKMLGVWKYAATDATKCPQDEDWIWHSGISGDMIMTHGTRGGVRDNLHVYLDIAGYVDVVTLLIGTNDIGAGGKTAEETYTAYTNLVADIARQRPNTKIIGSTILDRDGEGTANHGKVVAFNALLKADYAAGRLPANYTMIDLFESVPLTTGAEGNFFDDKLHPHWVGCAAISEEYASAIMGELPFATYAGTIETTATDVPQTAQGAEATVPAEYRAGMTHVFTIDKADAANNLAGTPPYTATPNPTAATRPVRRAGYYMELVRAGTNRRRYVWVDYGADGKLLDDVDWPWTGANMEYVVTNLHVYSNDPSIHNVAANDNSVTGAVEATHYNYSGTDQDGKPADTTAEYCGWNDTHQSKENYACFQAHRLFGEGEHWHGGEVLFAWNRWGRPNDNDEIGIGTFFFSQALKESDGNYSSDYTWTFTAREGAASTLDASAYQVKHLEIWAELAPARHGVWVGGVSSDFDTGANWEDGLVPLAGEDLWFDGVATNTTVSVTGASANLFFGNAAMGAQLVTFTGGIGFTNITDTSKIGVGANATVTLDGDLLFTGSGTKYVVYKVDAEGKFIVTGKVGVSEGENVTLQAQYSPGTGTIVAGGLVDDGTSWIYIAHNDNATTQTWAIGPDGISGTTADKGLWVYSNSKVNPVVRPNTNDFAVSLWMYLRQNAKSFTLDTTGLDGEGHVITLDAGFNNGNETQKGGPLVVSGAGKVVVNHVTKKIGDFAAYNGDVTVSETATLAINAGKVLTSGTTVIKAGAALELPDSATAGVTLDGWLKFGEANNKNNGTRLVLNGLTQGVTPLELTNSSNGYSIYTGTGTLVEFGDNPPAPGTYTIIATPNRTDDLTDEYASRFHIADPQLAQVCTFSIGADKKSLILTVGDYWLWTGGASGDWDDAANWLTGKKPSVAGVGADFFFDTPGAVAVNVNGAFAPKSITFLSGSGAVTLGGSGSFSGVAAVTNVSTTVSHEIAVPVHFAGDIQVSQPAMGAVGDLDKAHVTFSGGAYAAAGFALESGDFDPIYSRCVFGEYYLANDAAHPWTNVVGATTMAERRVCVASGAKLHIPYAGDTRDIWVGDDAQVIVGEMTLPGGGRPSVINMGEFVVTNLLVTGTSDIRMTHGQSADQPAVFKFHTVTNALTADRLYFSDDSSVEPSAHVYFIGEGGLNFDGDRGTYCFGNMQSGNVETMRPWYSDFTIQDRGGTDRGVLLQQNVVFNTDDESGVGRTITIDAITKCNSSPSLTVSGSGTLKVNKMRIPVNSGQTEPVVVVTNTATLALAPGAGLSTGATTVRSGATLMGVAGGAAATAGGTLTMEGGAALAVTNMTSGMTLAPLGCDSFATSGTGKVVLKLYADEPLLANHDYPLLAATTSLGLADTAAAEAAFEIDASGVAQYDKYEFALKVEDNTLYLTVTSHYWLWCGPASGNFNEPTNWVPNNGVPPAGADIFFAPTGTVSVTVDATQALHSATVLTDEGVVQLVKSGENTLSFAGEICGPGAFSPGTTALAVEGDIAASSNAVVVVADGLAVGGGDVTLAKGATLALPYYGSYSATAPVVPGTLSVVAGDGDTVKIRLGDDDTVAFGGRIKVLTAEGGFAAGVTAADFSLDGATVPGGAARFEIDGNDLWLVAGGDFVWTGLGDGKNFSDPHNWENDVIAPTNGADISIHVKNASTLTCDIADFQPRTVTFLADSAKVTVKGAEGCYVSNVLSVVNYADDVHHDMDLPVFFKDGVLADVTLSNKRYIRFYGGMTAWDVKVYGTGESVDTQTYYYGNFEYTREGINWSNKNYVNLPKWSYTTLVIHKGTVSRSRNFDIRTSCTLRNIGDYTVKNAYERTAVVAKDYGTFEVTGSVVGQNNANLRPSTGTSKGTIRAYGLVNENASKAGELTYNQGDNNITWALGEGGLTGTAGFMTHAVRQAQLQTQTDFAIAAPIANASSLVLTTTGDQDGLPHTITISNTISGAGSVVAKGKGTVRFAADGTFTGGVLVQDSATLHVAANKAAGAGDVTMAKGTTLLVPHGAGTTDSLVAFAGAYSVSGANGKVKIRFDGYEPPEGDWVKVFEADSFDLGGLQTAQVFDFGFLAASKIEDGALWLNRGSYGYIWADGASEAAWDAADKWTVAGTLATWLDNSPAVFTNAGDKATLAADATATELIFQKDATVLAGGGTLTVPSVTVAAGAAASIAAPTAGALEKSGAGTLVLTQGRTAQTTLSEGTLVMPQGATIAATNLKLGTQAGAPVVFDYGGQELDSLRFDFLGAGCDVTLTNGTFKSTAATETGAGASLPSTLTVAKDATLWVAHKFYWNTASEFTLNIAGGTYKATPTDQANWTRFMNDATTGTLSLNVTDGALMDFTGDAIALICQTAGGEDAAPTMNWLLQDSTLRVGDGKSVMLGQSNLNTHKDLGRRLSFFATNSTIVASGFYVGGNYSTRPDGAGAYQAVLCDTVVTGFCFRVNADSRENSVMFDGARLVLTTDGSYWLASEIEFEEVYGGLKPITVGSRGLVMDSNGHNGSLVADPHGAGAITKTGAGKMTITRDQTETSGALVVEQGEAYLDPWIVVSRPTTVKSGATLGVPGGTPPVVANLALEGGSTLRVATLDANAASASALEVDAITLPAEGKVAISATPTAGYVYPVVTKRFGTFVASDAAKFTAPAGWRAAVSLDGKSIILTSGDVWTGATAADGVATPWATGGNWAGLAVPTATARFFEDAITGSRIASFDAATSISDALYLDAGNLEHPVVFEASSANAGLTAGLLNLGTNAVGALWLKGGAYNFAGTYIGTAGTSVGRLGIGGGTVPTDVSFGSHDMRIRDGGFLYGDTASISARFIDLDGTGTGVDFTNVAVTATGFNIGVNEGAASRAVFNGGSLTLTGGDYLVVGYGKESFGKMYATNLTLAAANTILIAGRNDNANCTSAAGMLEKSGGDWTVGNNFYVGYATNSYAAFIHNGGTTAVTGAVVVAHGVNSTAELYLNGGSITANSWGFCIGQNDNSDAASARFVIDGGAATNLAGNLSIGDRGLAGSTAEVLVRNGEYYAGAGNVVVGGRAQGTLTIEGGKVTAPNYVRFCDNAECGEGEDSVVNLNGGVLATKGVQYGNGSANATFMFDGGTLKALADNANFFPVNNKFRLVVASPGGSAVFDTDGHDITIGCWIWSEDDELGSGAVSVTGGGTVTFAENIATGGRLTVRSGSGIRSGGDIEVNDVHYGQGQIEFEANTRLHVGLVPGEGGQSVASCIAASALFIDGPVTVVLDNADYQPGEYPILVNHGDPNYTYGSAQNQWAPLTDADLAKFTLDASALRASGRESMFELALGTTLYGAPSIVLRVRDTSNYWLWVGGASGDFSSASNWLTGKSPSGDDGNGGHWGDGADFFFDTPGAVAVNVNGEFAPGSITFLSNSGAVTLSGTVGSFTGVAAVTNVSTTVSHEIAVPVYFAGDIQVKQPAMGAVGDLNMAHVTFSGGAYAAAGFALESGDFAPIYSRCVFGEYYLANDAAHPWTNVVAAADRRVRVASGAKLHIPYAGNTRDIWVGNDAQVIVGEMTLSDGGRPSVINQGEVLVTNVTARGSVAIRLTYGQEKPYKSVFKFHTVTNALDGDFYFSDGSVAGDQEIYIGEGGLNFEGPGGTYRFGNMQSGNVETIRPWYSDFTIADRGGNSRALMLQQNVVFNTDDESGVGRTITVNAKTKGNSTPYVTVSGSGTLMINKMREVGRYADDEPKVAVTNTATLALAPGAGLSTNETTFAAGTSLVATEAGAGTATAGGAVTMAGGSSLVVSNMVSGVTSAALKATTFDKAGEGAIVVAVYAPASMQGGDYVLVSGLSDTASEQKDASGRANADYFTAPALPKWADGLYIKDVDGKHCLVLRMKPRFLSIELR